MDISTLDAPAARTARRKPLPHKHRHIGGHHSPIIPGAVYFGLKVIRQVPSDKQGNRRVEYECFCGQVGCGRFGNLWQGIIKSCGCLRVACYKKRQADELEMISAETRRKILTDIINKVNVSVIAAAYGMEKALVDFVRRSEYDRLDAISASRKLIIDRTAAKNMLSAQTLFNYSHAEVMVIHTLESQRRQRERVELEEMAALEQLLWNQSTPALPMSQQPLFTTDGPAYSSAWQSRTEGYREEAWNLADRAKLCAVTVCKGDGTNEITSEDLMNPTELKGYTVPRKIFNAIAPLTHAFLENWTSKANLIFEASHVRNRQRMKKWMDERAARILPLTQAQAANETRQKAWLAARQKARRLKASEITPVSEMHSLGVLDATSSEQRGMVLMLDEVAKASNASLASLDLLLSAQAALLVPGLARGMGLGNLPAALSDGRPN